MLVNGRFYIEDQEKHKYGAFQQIAEILPFSELSVFFNAWRQRRAFVLQVFLLAETQKKC